MSKMVGKSTLMIGIQLTIGVILLIIIGFYAGIQNLFPIFRSLDIKYIILTLIAYFIMNVIFAFRLKRVIRISGKHVRLSPLLLIQYGGMLASDFTPARSGYLTVPLMLDSEGVPVHIGLSSILGIQSIEFLVKMVGGVIAMGYLVSRVEVSREILIISIIGMVLMCIGSVVIAASMWSKRLTGFLTFLTRLPLINRVFKALFVKIKDFQDSSSKVKEGIFEITVLSLVSWVVKGVEWWFIGLAVGIGEISFIGYFLLHPLITALSFVPLTPSGIGFQEGGIVGVMFLLGVTVDRGLVFALLARVLLMLEDSVGIFPITKTGVKILSDKIS